MDKFRSLVLLVTTVCDRRCPDCCYRIPWDGPLGKPQHYPWEYFEHAAQHLRGIERLFISGGEPTLHPEFPRIAKEIRALFSTPSRKPGLELVTNGSRLGEHANWIDRFDKVWVTKFGSEPLSPDVVLTQERFPGRISVLPLVHRHVDKWVDGGGAGPCDRYYVSAYANGRLYPCCVSPGIPEATSVEPTADWQGRLDAVPRPCAWCTFSQGVPL